MTQPELPLVSPFITRWAASGAAERANYQLFLSELCDVLEVARPQPTTPAEAANAYVFEKAVPLPHGATGRIDLYRRGCFVLEAKQGRDADAGAPALSLAGQAANRVRKRGAALRGAASWDTAMERARQQAQSYARNLPPAEVAEGGRPPFLIVADVGDSLALYSEFTRSGGNYVPFPDPAHYRLKLADLADPDVRALLRQVWLDPMSLDPSRRSARVTRDIADRLARLARALEGAHDPQVVAHFLMRCLFTMFAEDVGLLPTGSFTQLLADARHSVAHFPVFVRELWQAMAAGGFSLALRAPIKHFNGGLFADPSALPLTADQLQLLIEAAQADWRDVEPAIFGTLLERALDPAERHKLGAHFTPRAYVERLVLPALVEPLRAEWEAVQAAAARLADEGEGKKALAEIEAFQRRLAGLRVLDPACGSGNFLYVSLEHLMRLQAEVLEVRRQVGGSQMLLDVESVTVSPRQFLGLEVNPRAAAIAELVLWIGYLQWRLRSEGDLAHLAEPIIRSFHNIECRDAVLAWDAVEPLLDAAGRPVTRWDGLTTRPHPVTGEPVPDETARVPAWRYLNPRPAAWPEADFIVGNPPFIGNKRMRFALGDGYTEALRITYGHRISNTADYVMYWWDKASELTRQGRLRRFGFITTNSITQVFNRSVVESQLQNQEPISLVYAIPDHPWVDSAEGAAVRIAMTVGASGKDDGQLVTVIRETSGDSDGVQEVSLEVKRGQILADLSVGTDVGSAKNLLANRGLSSQGANPLGLGFRLTRDELESYGFKKGTLPTFIRPYCIGRDLVQRFEEKYVIDFSGHTEHEARTGSPVLYQHLLTHVKPERDQNRRQTRKENWWLFGENAPMFRQASRDLHRYIATCRTAKHRLFTFLPVDTIPDAKIVAIALEDAFFLGVLSSRIHLVWALRTGAFLEDRPNYNHSDCFGKFPFPDATDARKARIRALAEELDAHRKRQQAQHPRLTLTDLYNVLAKLRRGEALTAKEKLIHEQGLVSILAQLHDDLDAAVADAYGWPAPSASSGYGLSDEEILVRLVALNAERAAEEASGLIRWLRPDYQAPAGSAPQAQQAALEIEEAEAGEVAAALRAWPEGMAAQAAAVRGALAAFAGRPVSAAEVAAAFSGASPTHVAEWLATLVALGQARALEDGRFVAG